MTDAGSTFMTYIKNGREYFVYEEHGREIKKDFPFPESLLTLMYLDIWSLEPHFRTIDRALMKLYSEKEESYAETVSEELDLLAGKHVYFEFLKQDWEKRLDRARAVGYQKCMDLLPHKAISHIPSNIDTIQKQLKLLFAQVLDVDVKDKRSVPEKMVSYYDYYGKRPLDVYQFQPLTLNLEVVDVVTFAEVLRPTTIYDLIDYAVRECVRRELRMRVCKHCRRYFAISKRLTAEYCDLPIDDKGRTCKDVAAGIQWTRRSQEDEVFTAYRREYKKRFGWIRAGKIDKDSFYAWGERAREKKEECETGTISQAEFERWLKES